MKPFYSTRTIYRCFIGLTLLVAIPFISFAQPVNDVCGSAITLTSTTVCGVGTAGTLRAIAGGSPSATATAGIGTICTHPATSIDMWYRFQAQSPYPVITLFGMGSSMDNAPGLAIFTDASCTGATLAANLLGCVSATNSATLTLNVGTAVGGVGLTIGTFYKIRVSSNIATAAAPSANWNFNICVTDPPPAVPPNDECAGAITVPVGAACGNIWMTALGATQSAGFPSPCAGGSTYDVWYKFVATATPLRIEINGAANNFANRRIQLFRGPCGALTNVGCATVYPYTTPALTLGATYYIRVYSNSGTTPQTNADFQLCVYSSTGVIPPRFGNSYVNLSKKTNGGVVQNGDTLEIRMTINHTSGTIYAARYVDNIPTNTVMLSGAGDSIRVITNEGLTFRRYTPTPNVNNDAATYRTSPLAANTYNIRLNLGFGVGAPGPTIPTAPANNTDADITGAGQITNADRPEGGGGVLFATSFRVKVTGIAGDTIKFSTGKFIYRTGSAAGTEFTLLTTPYQILISNPLTLCENSVGLNSAEETGGTFGAGDDPNRITDLQSPIAGYTLVNLSSAQGIGDGQYGVIKNMSPTSSTTANANKQPSCGTPPPALDCNNRMHGGYWDIAGDHSGTVTAAGNPPPLPGANAGYMLMVNADYVASEAFRQRLPGLCSSTYYEFSAWIRNVCTACGNDSLGNQTYKPGVYPNLTFALDGIDRYSTGQMDTIGWTKKGFVFLTGDTQTVVTLTIRNNSQGGGGNDWAMDDIRVATCMPEMAYSPSANPIVCQLNARTIYDTVRSYFDNYRYYVWQRSEDGGANWTDVTTVQGPATPVFNNTTQSWEYLTHFLIHPAWTTIANNGDLYRVVAATNVDNLTTSNCIFTSSIPFLTLNVLNCGTPLKTDLLSFNGKLAGDYSNLTWITSKEDEPVKYQLERSTDGSDFTVATVINGYNNNAEQNTYSFTDPVAVTGKVYYRVIIINNSNPDNKKYSRIISLSKQADNKFTIGTVVNPFGQSLYFDINTPVDTKIEAELLDMTGTVVKRKSYMIHSGINMLILPDTGSLPGGNYIFRVKNNNQIMTRKIIKGNNL